MSFARLFGFPPLQLLSLLKWSMLAACTIGPGTVVVCSKSGADYQLQLQWTLVAASFVAFVLQKEVRRLVRRVVRRLGHACSVAETRRETGDGRWEMGEGRKEVQGTESPDELHVRRGLEGTGIGLCVRVCACVSVGIPTCFPRGVSAVTAERPFSGQHD